MRRILGIDYGTKVIGLAIFKEGDDPYPLTNGRIVVQDFNQVVLEIKNAIDEDCLDTIAIGVPRLLDGQETSTTQRVKKFITDLRNEIPNEVSIHEVDETLSTYEAKERMKKSPAFNFKVDLKKIDEVSAQIIIESFLNENS